MRFLLTLPFFLQLSVAQTINDIWQTSSDKSTLLKKQDGAPIQFYSNYSTYSVDIKIDENTVYQQMDGFGAALTDSSAQVLSELKASNPTGYWALLNALFSPDSKVGGAALNAIRVPIGASDFAATTYTYDDVEGDHSLTHFSVDNAPAYLWSTLQDIKQTTQYLKIFLAPWSAPAWMKDQGSVNGGQLSRGMEDNYAQYLFKSVQDISNKGLLPYAISVQNEPQFSESTYPTMLLPVDQAALVGKKLRSLLDSNNLGMVKTIGYDHNWDNAATYPVELMQQARESFNGIAFHCYRGDVSGQLDFHNAFPDAEIYFTECVGTLGTDWWSNIQWNMDHLAVGSVDNFSRTVMFWNLALHSDGSPKTPGTDSCGDGCRAVVNVDGNDWSLNEEYYVLAHSSIAVIPRDNWGPFANRVKVEKNGDRAASLKVQAYMNKGSNIRDESRYSIVVLNSDSSSIQASISFNGNQAVYDFPVGVTTLWWYK